MSEAGRFREPDQYGRRSWWGRSLDTEVAEAIGGKYPDRAFAIYMKHAEAAIPRGYEEGAAILRHARRMLLKAGRKDEWTYLAQLREKNQGRPRCIEEFDRLERESADRRGLNAPFAGLQGSRVLIGNNLGRINGWVEAGDVLGRVEAVRC